MNYFIFKIMSIFLLIGTIVSAQSNVMNSAFDEESELSKLSGKYPKRRVFYPEEFGEQLSNSTTEELLHRLVVSKDTIELRKIAQVLGDRQIGGTLKLTDKEITIIDNRIRAYIHEKADFYRFDSEAYNQMLRFWHLAIPELLKHLEDPNSNIQLFVANILVQIRNERVVSIIIDKAKRCKEGDLKNMYIGTLNIMTQQEEMNVPNRACMDEKSSQELFDRLIKPALKELSPSTEENVKD